MNDDKLDRILRHDAATSRPADGGFTRRVMETLPAPVPRARAWTTPALVMGSAMLGSVLAFALAPVGFTQAAIDLSQLNMLTRPAITAIAIAGALLASAVVLAADAD
jgi:hypothetical protein